MKKYLLIMVASIAALVTGCKDKSDITPEEVKTMANTIGVTAGTVANVLQLDAEMKEHVIIIFDDVSKCTPLVGQKFTEAWTPIAKAHIDELVEQQKITDVQAKILTDLFDVVVRSMDWFVFTKNPKIGEDLALVEAAIHGFCDGFLSVFHSSADVVGTPAIDQELYDYLTK